MMRKKYESLFYVANFRLVLTNLLTQHQAKTTKKNLQISNKFFVKYERHLSHHFEYGSLTLSSLKRSLLSGETYEILH
jgi:hypothetical protein